MRLVMDCSRNRFPAWYALPCCRLPSMTPGANQKSLRIRRLRERPLEHKQQRFANEFAKYSVILLRRDVLESERRIIMSHLFGFAYISFVSYRLCSFFFTHANQVELMNAIDPGPWALAMLPDCLANTTDAVSCPSITVNRVSENRKDINVSDKRAFPSPISRVVGGAARNSNLFAAINKNKINFFPPFKKIIKINFTNLQILAICRWFLFARCAVFSHNWTKRKIPFLSTNERNNFSRKIFQFISAAGKFDASRKRKTICV